MADLKGKEGEVHMTLEVIRKETGKKEIVQVVGYVNKEDLEKLKEKE